MGCKLYSVYPLPLTTPIGQFGEYRIPAADDPDHKSKIPGCSVITIPDRVIADYKGMKSGNGEPRYEHLRFSGEEIIDGFILTVFEGRGMFRLNEGEELTKERVEKAQAELTAFFAAEFDRADSMWEKTGQRAAISDVGRAAARYLGQKPEWVTEVSAKNVPCKMCAEPIKAAALKCKHCGSLQNEPAVAQATAQVAAAAAIRR